MSESLTQELTVTITTDGGELAVSPRSLLEHFLPGATALPGRPNVFEGRVPGKPDKKCYVQTEALAGMLLDCREKKINPVSDCYLIPATSPDRRAGHKIKYSVGLERMRDIPGFLGINAGLVVEREGKIERRTGRMAHPGDTVVGAWAKAYFQGLPEPIEHEVSLDGSENEGTSWKERPGFMLLKVVEDELWRLKVAPLRAKERPHADDAILLEGSPLREVPKQEPKLPERATQDTKAEDKPSPFKPGELYTGTVLTIGGPSVTEEKGKQKKLPGKVEIETAQGPLTCLYWAPPAVLAPPKVWPSLIGKLAAMSFLERKNDQGTVYRFIDTLDLATDDKAADIAGEIPADDRPAQPTAEGGKAA